MATIKIDGDIGKDFWGLGIDASDVLAQLDQVPEGEPVTVHINSCGGSVTDGVAIFHALRDCGHEVTTRVCGLAASIASIIFLAGSKRQVCAGSFLFLHNAWTSAQGNASDLQKAASDLGIVTNGLIDIYAQTTGLSRPEIEALLDSETLMGADEAFEKGFANVPAQVQQGVSASRALGVMAQLSAKNLLKITGANSMSTKKKIKAEAEPLAEVVEQVAPTAEAAPEAQVPTPTAEPAVVEPAAEPAVTVQDAQAKASVETLGAVGANLTSQQLQDAAANASAAEVERVKALKALAFQGFDWFALVESRASVVDATAKMYSALKEKFEAQAIELEALQANAGIKAQAASTLAAIQVAGAAVPVADITGDEGVLEQLRTLKGAERTKFYRAHESAIKAAMRG